MIPKYRVWDTVKKAMSEVQAVVYTEKKVYPIYSEVVRRYVPFSEAVLMQSTGLKDKEGTEVFEGDIVKTTRFFGRADEASGFYKEMIGIVKQLEGAWVIDTGNNAVDLWSEIEENEVMGNVYEQPEYLKKRGS